MLLDRTMWEQSGHWDKFKENMFQVESEQRLYAVKPMNVQPVQIFKNSWEAIRITSQIGRVWYMSRNEPSGTTVLMRLYVCTRWWAYFLFRTKYFCRNFKFMLDALKVYKLLGWGCHSQVFYSSRATVGRFYLGSLRESPWRNSEWMGIDWSLAPGEGAFYGPKLELSLKDSLGRFGSVEQYN